MSSKVELQRRRCVERLERYIEKMQECQTVLVEMDAGPVGRIGTFNVKGAQRVSDQLISDATEARDSLARGELTLSL